MKLKAVSGIMLTLLLIGMLTMVFNIQSAKSEPRTWTVDDDEPADFHTIQEAVNAASPAGDTIFVHNGTYYENLIVNKTISLVGENMDTTIIYGNGAGNVVLVEGADNVTVTGFTVRNGSSGFCILGFNHTIIGNIISNNTHHGIDLVGRNNRISENIIKNNRYGIIFSASSYNIISRNTIMNNQGGINLCEDCEDNDISENTLMGNTMGIGIVGNNNSVVGNTIKENWSGIEIAGINNTIYHNNFINNTVQANVTSGYVNIWDDGYPSGGNYWSDYNGTDFYSGPCQNETGSDDIGDTPYVIVENNADRYPLMKTWTPTPPVITATIDVAPDTLNLKSKGKWITCYIELSEGYNISDVDRTTILLNDTIQVDSFWMDKPLESVVGDYDSDGIPDLMVKFSRASVIEYLQNIMYGNVTLRVTGELYNGTSFEGSDMIRVKMPSDATVEIPSEATSDNEYFPVLPEFPSFLILTLFMIATLLAVTVYRRKHNM